MHGWAGFSGLLLRLLGTEIERLAVLDPAAAERRKRFVTRQSKVHQLHNAAGPRV